MWQGGTWLLLVLSSHPPPRDPSWASTFGPLQWPPRPGHDLGLKPSSSPQAAGTPIHPGPLPYSGCADLPAPPPQTLVFAALSAGPAVSEELRPTIWPQLPHGPRVLRDAGLVPALLGLSLLFGHQLSSPLSPHPMTGPRVPRRRTSTLLPGWLAGSWSVS